MMIDLEALREWQQQGRRTVKIEMGSIYDNGQVSVWVYDYDLSIGQLIKSVDEIDLEKRRKEQLEQVVKELALLQSNEPVLKF